MRINSIGLKNFKRFADLRIENIPENAKLVLLIGSNGSGKSSLFDAFDWLGKGVNKPYKEGSIDYYEKRKESVLSLQVHTHNNGSITKEGSAPSSNTLLAKKFIGRSSNRIVPRISSDADPNLIQADLDSPETYIDNDIRFLNDSFKYIEQLDNALREPAFSGKSADTLQIFQEFIRPLNLSFQKIFGDDNRTTIQIAELRSATPYTPPQLVFKKGDSKINYDLLSHGEKQVVILLLNFIVRKKYYEDAIIFIDEMDCHLNTALQKTLLEEIVNKWIPDSSQLWTASHALGFIDYARQSGDAVILDFDLLDFDQPQVLLPQSKENLDIYEIAIPKDVLSDVLKDRKLVMCENQNDEYYNFLKIEKTLFVGLKDSRSVFLDIKRDLSHYGLRDRDFLSDSEILKLKKKYPHYSILEYYDFENYLYHPDNISQLNPIGFDMIFYKQDVLDQKNKRKDYILAGLVSSRQNYEEFKTDETLKDKDVDSIIEDLASDIFEKFYKFFDMKGQFNKSYLAGFNLSKEDLVKTGWFKDKISKILK